jgi:UDP-N-acetylmuramoyl-tripeptide--D-alanyl-D-alanine ligase
MTTEFTTPIESLREIYRAYLQAPGVATRIDAVCPGDVYFALPRHEPQQRIKHLLWRTLGFAELYAPWLLALVSGVLARIPGGSKAHAGFETLRREKFSGSAHGPEAITRGAALAVIDSGRMRGGKYIRVPHAGTAFRELAIYHRRQLKIPVIGITGSCGKTTTKELVTAVLRKKFRTVSTPDSFNSIAGVCHTVLSIKADDEIAVFEIGSIGEHDAIAQKVAIADPDFGIVTLIGKAHLQGFGDLSGVVQIKRQLFDHVARRNGLFFLNTADPNIVSFVGDYPNVWTYGDAPSCDTQGSCVADRAQLSVEWLRTDKQGENNPTAATVIQTQLFGRMNLTNVLAAIAVGTRFGVAPDLVQQALSEFKPENLRSQILSKGSTTIILDAFNANPTSMGASLQDFASIRSTRKSVVLGEMLELGEHSLSEHQQVLASLGSMNLQDIFLVGQEFARAGGAAVGRCFGSVDDLIASVPLAALAGAHVLVKGSRKVGLERYVLSLD